MKTILLLMSIMFATWCHPLNAQLAGSLTAPAADSAEVWTDEYVFRKVKWGMTLEEVYNSELNAPDITGMPKLFKDSSSLGYIINTFDSKAKILPSAIDYWFSDSNELNSISLEVTCPALGMMEEDCEGDHFLSNFERLLIIKYGIDSKIVTLPSVSKTAKMWSTPTKEIVVHAIDDGKRVVMNYYPPNGFKNCTREALEERGQLKYTPLL